MAGPLSPIRSPGTANWKAVGSPISPALNDEDIRVKAFEEELKKSLAASTSNSSPDKGRVRRQRAMSMIERNLSYSRPFTPFDVDWTGGNSNQGLPLNGIKNVASLSGTGSRTSKSPSRTKSEFSTPSLTDPGDELPQLLQTTLGLREKIRVIEALESPQVDTIKSPDKKSQGMAKNSLLRNMPSLFGLDSRKSFGAESILFDGLLKSPPNGVIKEEPEEAASNTKRHSSLFGTFLDWVGRFPTQEFSVDEYFMGSTMRTSTRKLNGTSSRRHSIAGLNDFSEHQQSSSRGISSIYGESDLSPDAASFQFKRSGSLVDTMATLDALNSFSNTGQSPTNSILSSSTFRDATFHLSTYKGPLYAVEFKAGRTEIFYVLETDGRPQIPIQVGDLVIVEADRGEDLGKVTMELSVSRLKQLMNARVPVEEDSSGSLTPELLALVQSKEIIPKRIHRLAQAADLKLLQAKAQEEAIAMVRCQSRIRQKKLPMEVVDAEYQWDRNKLTFYFFSDRRIDFRELVRDLFRIYKTRIWMCAVDKHSPRMQLYNSTLLSSGGIDVCPVVTEIPGFAAGSGPNSYLLESPYSSYCSGQS